MRPTPSPDSRPLAEGRLQRRFRHFQDSTFVEAGVDFPEIFGALESDLDLLLALGQRRRDGEAQIHKGIERQILDLAGPYDGPLHQHLEAPRALRLRTQPVIFGTPDSHLQLLFLIRQGPHLIAKTTYEISRQITRNIGALKQDSFLENPREVTREEFFDCKAFPLCVFRMPFHAVVNLARRHDFEELMFVCRVAPTITPSTTPSV